MEKLLIIQLSGGIGNQLFQLANAYQLSLTFNRKLLISNKNSSPRNTYWENVLVKFKDFLINNDEFNKLKSKATIYNWAMTRFEYKEIILNDSIECYCIEGYYQTFKYFDLSIFKNMLNLNFKQNKYTIQDNDVAVHIRRTDYTNNNFHKVLSINYYFNCFKFLNKEVNINKMYVFSDDLKWCKEHFKYTNIEYVSCNNEIEELIFMSTFNYFIIANSSFSWWASYLSNAKKIYCPEHWFINGCHLNTKDLKPNHWITIDDDLPYLDDNISRRFNKNVFNVISLGCACCVVQNIHDNIYKHLGPLYAQSGNKTNFFDWVITDFKGIVYLFENLVFRDDQFLSKKHFTSSDVYVSPNKLHGGWSSVYKKVENKEAKMIFLHDVEKQYINIPNSFFEKYKRRFERLYYKLLENDIIHFIHCFDFQWLSPYFPNKEEINTFFKCCKQINPTCNVQLYFLIHPNYNNEENQKLFLEYTSIQNLNVFYLEDKGWKDDWKAAHLTFDKFFA